MLSRCVQRANVRDARRRSAAVSRKPSAKASMASGGYRTCPRSAATEARVGVGAPALLDLAQTMSQRVDQHPAPPRVVQQVVLKVRIALHDPDVAQHLEQHARGTPVRRWPRSRHEQSPIGSPRSLTTISRSENDV
jgi:hypothetical protein